MDITQGLTTEQIHKAFILWFLQHPQKIANDQLSPFLNSQISSTSQANSRLCQAREALWHSKMHLASQLKISTSAYFQIESSEAAGTITLNKLREAAAAMDCELVYAIRPRSRKLFAEILWQKLLQATKNHPWVSSRPASAKTRALLAIVRRKESDIQFRRQNHWTQNRRSLTSR